VTASGTPVELPRGAFVMSIDTELAWGEAHRRDGTQGRHRLDAEREVIDAMLDLFARYDIAATWAIVGHLFLDACGDDGGGAHPELVPPDYPWLDEPWLAVDPCSTLAEAPHWYGRDIVDAILACPVAQEIGSHSFSHVIVDDPACTREVFASELAAAARVAAERRVDLRSFVYPRNSIDQIERLVEHGYRCYRGGRTSAPFAGRPAWQRRGLAVVDKVRPLRGSATRPARHASGIWNVPQTYLFAPAGGSRMPPTVWARRPVARLRQAARDRSLFHLWFHPYNVTADPERALPALEAICRAADRLRDAGDLDVLTMGALAARLDAGGDEPA
jgi:peptidoglycan/xylan/chitin deacetylase (PgdA/CDA1 family)